MRTYVIADSGEAAARVARRVPESNWDRLEDAVARMRAAHPSALRHDVYEVAHTTTHDGVICTARCVSPSEYDRPVMLSDEVA